MKMRVWTLGLLLLGLMACETAPPVTEADRVRGYNESPNAVFTALLRTCHAMDIEIVAADRESGFLVGRMNIGGEAIFAALTGEVHTVFRTYRVNIFPKADGHSRVEVRITSGLEDGRNTSESNYYDYQWFWQKLLEQLRAEQ